MEDKHTVIQNIKEYTDRFKNEQERVEPLLLFLKTNKDDELYNRKNFKGHITASAFIVDSEWKCLLMIKHKALNRWLQPGGHIEMQDTSLINAAMREAVEETGISAEEISPAHDFIFDVDSHVIPFSNKKNEPEHVHHDIRFLFKCTSIQHIVIDKDEVTAAEWIAIEDVLQYPDFELAINKIIDSSKQFINTTERHN